MARILLYTGKGGVGKTSVAAASAVLCAERGYRTIVLSTDIAHSLADALDIPLGPEPRTIAPNLDAQEPDVYFNVQRYWRTIQAYVATLFSWHGLDEVHGRGDDDPARHGRAGQPALDRRPPRERHLRRHRRGRRPHRRDAAPAVHAGGQPLVGRADRADRPPRDADRRAVDPARASASRCPTRRCSRRRSGCSDGSIGVHTILGDPDHRARSGSCSTSRRCPSPRRSARSPTSTCTATRPTSSSTNRVLPENAGELLRADAPSPAASTCPCVARGLRAGAGPDDPLVRAGDGRRRAPARARDGALRRRATRPQIFYRGRPYSVKQRQGRGYTLELELPFTSRDEVGLSRHGDELVLQVGGWRRTLVLPRALVDAQTLGAKMETTRSSCSSHRGRHREGVTDGTEEHQGRSPPGWRSWRAGSASWRAAAVAGP